MYSYVEQAPEESKHIILSRPVPDGKPCDVNKHHFHGVTFSRCLLWLIVMTTDTLLAHVSEYSFAGAANKSEKSEEAVVLLQIKSLYTHDALSLHCNPALGCNFFEKPSPTLTHTLLSASAELHPGPHWISQQDTWLFSLSVSLLTHIQEKKIYF